MKKLLLAAAAAALLCGCAGYRWTSSVPEKMRTVQVPTFRNSADLTEVGSVVTVQLLREFQREGTFKILSDGAALEIQGEVVSASAQSEAANYRIGSRFHGGMLKITARVSVIDKRNGRILVDNCEYSGEAHYSAGQDNTTAMRDASGRAADDLAQKVVDAVLAIDFNGKTEK